MPGSIGTTYDQKYNTEGIGEKGRLGAGASGSISSIVERIGSITKKDIADSTARLSFDAIEGLLVLLVLVMRSKVLLLLKVFLKIHIWLLCMIVLICVLINLAGSLLLGIEMKVKY
jgi:hypothetical protein